VIDNRDAVFGNAGGGKSTLRSCTRSDDRRLMSQLSQFYVSAIDSCFCNKAAIGPTRKCWPTSRESGYWGRAEDICSV
jgi:hypothetical protein